MMSLIMENLPGSDTLGPNSMAGTDVSLQRRQQGCILVNRPAVETALDDLLAERKQVAAVELLHLLVEEVVEHLGAGVVRLFADLRLRVHLEEPARDEGPLDLHLEHCVAEQRA